MNVHIANWPKWLGYHVAQLIIAAGAFTLLFTYAWRLLFHRFANSPAFYTVTAALGLSVLVAWRREYVFVTRYEFSKREIVVHTALGVRKRFSLDRFSFVPVLHEVLSFQRKVALSFSVKDQQSGRNIRNFSWAGFAAEDFRKVSQFYGCPDDVDFDQEDVGRMR